MRNDLQGLVLAGNTLLVVPEGLSEEEALIWAHYVDWLEDRDEDEDGEDSGTR